jgi:SAM-dependent methyltransferase
MSSLDHAYLETAHGLYRQAALEPDVGLCCTTTPIWKLPELSIPKRMLEMNYGCGSTVHPRDLGGCPTILYVGVGGGIELLQFAYFSRRPGAVIGVDLVDEMLSVCRANLGLAEKENSWFRSDFVDLRRGDALALPLEDYSVDVGAQNCLFNIFRERDLARALAEMYRVLKPHGRLALSDPVCEQEMPAALRNDDRLRAMCLSGAIPLGDYFAKLTDTGFGTIEVRARRPYRVLAPGKYPTNELIYIESVEICAIKDPMPADGPCVFTGRTAIYFGDQDYFDDGKGHVMHTNQPLAVCDKTARTLQGLGRSDLFVSASTWFYDGGGCC